MVGGKFSSEKVDDAKKVEERFNSSYRDSYRYFEYSDSKIFGLFRPILGAIFKIIFFILGVWILGFLVFMTGFQFLKNLYDFVLANLGFFFGLLFIFSYLDYFRKNFRKVFYLVSPFVNSIGPTVFFWVIANSILLTADKNSLDWVQQFALNYIENVFIIYGIFVFIGYSLLLIEKYVEQSEKISFGY